MKKAVPFSILIAMVFISFRPTAVLEDKITYCKNIKSLMEKKCGNCHASRHTYYPFGGDLSTYDSLKLRVDNGSLADHVFIKKDMPQSYGWTVSDRLDSAELKSIDDWIKSGAPN